ncbi:hypothetical protein C8Q76DRAFT_693192 [Earliella scabrosa]|nr:hypothetical protein C8Q76DRAFT_693192 [Earliella scabrosa]
MFQLSSPAIIVTRDQRTVRLNISSSISSLRRSVQDWPRHRLYCDRREHANWDEIVRRENLQLSIPAAPDAGSPLHSNIAIELCCRRTTAVKDYFEEVFNMQSIKSMRLEGDAHMQHSPVSLRPSADEQRLQHGHLAKAVSSAGYVDGRGHTADVEAQYATTSQTTATTSLNTVQSPVSARSATDLSSHRLEASPTGQAASPDINPFIIRHMDIPSMTIWRAVCHKAHEDVTAALKKDLLFLLRNFLPEPQPFLELFTDYKAIIGGEFALAFLLRGENFVARRLEVFTSEVHFQGLVHRIRSCPLYAAQVRFESMDLVPVPYVHSRAFQRYAKFVTIGGDYLEIFETSSTSPCTPISRTWCSALMNFVTAHSFGCAYPRLTFQLQSIVSDLRLMDFSEDDRQTMRRMVTCGFDFAREPTLLPPYAHLALTNGPPGIYRCLRASFICPDQARFFGDAGSMVVVLDALHGGHSRLRALQVAPYGHMSVWRLWCSSACDNLCLGVEDILPRGTISMPSIFSSGMKDSISCSSRRLRVQLREAVTSVMNDADNTFHPAPDGHQADWTTSLFFAKKVRMAPFPTQPDPDFAHSSSEYTSARRLSSTHTRQRPQKASLSSRVASSPTTQYQRNIMSSLILTTLYPSELRPVSVPVDVVVHIIWKSDFLLLLEWRKTCKAFFSVVTAVFYHRFEVAIKPFVGPRTSVLSDLIRRTGSVVSGSVALQFFVQDPAWQPKDLDIYVPDNVYEQFIDTAVPDLLFQSTPDARPSGPPPIDHLANGIKEITTFTTTTGKRVDVIRSPVNNPIFPLQFYWTTLVMNVITPDGCVCGYPLHTFQGKGIVRGGLLTEKEHAAISKYERRGFTFTQREWWQIMEGPANWTMDYFGDVTAKGLIFRRTTQDVYPRWRNIIRADVEHEDDDSDI